ncbi:DMT family transporter [Pollutimonas thiosulfatoxidans]|uniref:Guanidinium exporter n=1 Tax=Pollutimonas thiosulfatoxidans TaxID=2028345 RepID=A0A410GGB9_9BURK|nr:multidrug efflux SMR transporter [Pollutimonas thiosulfatoxidans]MBF6618174.1 multidrug efflux SMR transporter [Candidimonas sp.]QAA95347.1 hypothetical protein CKA81_16865 [Pollutimonas thiosulfatoxidans]
MSTVSLAWLYLIVSGLLDVAWAYSIKKTIGFQHLGWNLISLLLLAAFVYLLSKALTLLPLSAAYAVWTAIGIIGSVLVGVVLFHEHLSIARLVFLALVLIGIIGIRLT